MFDLLCKPSLIPKELLYTFFLIIFYIASSYFAQNKKSQFCKNGSPDCDLLRSTTTIL